MPAYNDDLEVLQQDRKYFVSRKGVILLGHFRNQEEAEISLNLIRNSPRFRARMEYVRGITDREGHPTCV